MSDPNSTPDANLSDAVAGSANGPMQVHVEGMGSSREFPLQEQIQAAKFKPNNCTQRRVGAGIRFTKATASGAV